LSGTYNDYVEYKLVRNKATQEYRLAVIEFEKKLASNIKEDVKSFYAYVNRNSNGKIVVDSLVNDCNELVVDREVMCKMYNDYFTSEDLSFNGIELNLNTQVDGKNYVTDLIITKEMVLNKLEKLKVNKASGVDNISPRLLHDLADVLAPPLAMIFNESVH